MTHGEELQLEWSKGYYWERLDGRHGDLKVGIWDIVYKNV